MASSEKPSKRSTSVATADMAAVYVASGMLNAPQVRALLLDRFDLSQCRHVVRGQQFEPSAGRVAPLRISQQNQHVCRGQAAQPRGDPFGRGAFVTHVAGQVVVYLELALNEILRSAFEAHRVQLR